MPISVRCSKQFTQMRRFPLFEMSNENQNGSKAQLRVQEPCEETYGWCKYKSLDGFSTLENFSVLRKIMPHTLVVRLVLQTSWAQS